MRVPASLTWSLPGWVATVVDAHGEVGPGDEERMALVLALGHAQIEHGSGGPFAAALFADAPPGLLAVGVNLVVPTSACTAHAEVVALALAGPVVGSYDLGAAGPVTLVTSTEPCAMCLGAVAWSGIGRLVCGASDADARAIGFDEGDKPESWRAKLARRGVDVTTGVRADEARALLASYTGPVYNAAPPVQ